MSRNIVLIGMPGSGKTTIGSLLSKKLNKKFIDMDELIEKTEEKSISDIFVIGEEHFRNIESNIARNLSNEKSSIVISTGGGIIKRKENIDFLKINSIIIFINRPLEKIIQDININNRPLLKRNTEDIYKLYNERILLYEKYSDLEILNDDTIECAVNKIINSILEMES